MNFIPSKHVAPTIHKLVKVSGKDRIEKSKNDLLKRDNMGKWIPNFGAAATEKMGLCYTTEAFRIAIEKFCAHINLKMTNSHWHLVDDVIAARSMSDEVGEVVLIENLDDNDQVGFAMRQVQGTDQKKAKVLSHPSLLERCKLVKAKIPPTSAIEAARKKMNAVSASLNEAIHSDKPVVGIDVEMFEHNHKHILEVGLSTIQGGTLKTKHFIIDEHKDVTNGKYVPDHKDSFHFGRSETVSLAEATEHVVKALENAQAVFGHAVGNDLRVLDIPQNVINKLKTFDTQDIHKLFAKAVASDQKTSNGLSSIAPMYLGESALDLSYHNAGNDIEVTGRVLMKQGDPAWVKSQYGDLSKHHQRFLEEQALLNKENLDRCISIFKKHFKEACDLAGTDVLDLAEVSPLQALDGFKLALEIKRRAESVKMVHSGIPMLDYLMHLESTEGGVSDLVYAINETSTEYATQFLNSSEMMAPPSTHRQMLRIALESPEFVKNLNWEGFSMLKQATEHNHQPEEGITANL